MFKQKKISQNKIKIVHDNSLLITKNVFSIYEVLQNNNLKLWLTDSTQGKIYNSSLIKNNGILFPTFLNIAEDNFFNYVYISCCTTRLEVMFLEEISCIDDISNLDSLSRKYNEHYIDEILLFYSELNKKIDPSLKLDMFISTYWSIEKYIRQEMVRRVKRSIIKNI